jgi:uncharacterized metal-binding protein YceD (DUF177 family)
MTDSLCQDCEVGELQACCGESAVMINGELYIVDGIQWMVCTRCLRSVETPEQVAANHETVATIRKALEFGA